MLVVAETIQIITRRMLRPHEPHESQIFVNGFTKVL